MNRDTLYTDYSPLENLPIINFGFYPLLTENLLRCIIKWKNLEEISFTTLSLSHNVHLDIINRFFKIQHVIEMTSIMIDTQLSIEQRC